MSKQTIIIVADIDYDEPIDICWASSLDHAIDRLIDRGWITKDYVSGYSELTNSWPTLYDRYGDAWADKMRSLSLERFNQIFYRTLEAREVELV